MKKYNAFQLFDAFIIVLCCFVCLLCRIPSLIKFGPMISETDSRFNWICAQYIEKNGILAFFDWFDNTSWYPQGRSIGQTTFPGLMILCNLLQRIFAFFHIFINLSTICIYIGPIFSILIPIFMYFLCQLLIDHRSVSLFSALFSSTNVILASCSFAGFYDNQSISVTLIIIILYLFFKSILSQDFQNNRKLNYCVVNILFLNLFYGLLSITSGEFIYVANIFALVSCLSIFFGFFTVNLYITYSIWFIFGTIILSSLSYVGSQVLYSFAHLFPNLAFVFIQIYMVYYFLHQQIILLISIVFISLIMLIILKLFGSDCFSLLGRIYYIIFPFFSNKSKSFYYSVEEQNPTSWSMFFVSLGPLLYFLPVGFYILFKKLSNYDRGSFYIIFMAIPTLYFATTMMRFLVIFSIYFIIIASLVIDNFLRKSFNSLFKKVSVFDSLISILLISFFCLLQIYHSIYFNFNPSYESTLYRQIEKKSIENKTEIVDSTDFNEALMWITNNTPKNSKFIALWPHGYQISSHTNRTVFCDGNTNNLTHINLIYLFYASSEINAWKIAKELDADYIVVIFGGASGMKFDDLYFTPSILKSLKIEYDYIKIEDYFNGPYLSSEKPTNAAKNSMIFKLSYYNFYNWSLNANMEKGFDISRGFKVGDLGFKMKLFNEVFTSENWIFRIYSVSNSIIE